MLLRYTRSKHQILPVCINSRTRVFALTSICALFVGNGDKLVAVKQIKTLNLFVHPNADVIRNLRFTSGASLSSDQNHAVSGSGAEYGCCRTVLQYFK